MCVWVSLLQIATTSSNCACLKLLVFNRFFSILRLYEKQISHSKSIHTNGVFAPLAVLNAHSRNMIRKGVMYKCVYFVIFFGSNYNKSSRSVRQTENEFLFFFISSWFFSWLSLVYICKMFHSFGSTIFRMWTCNEMHDCEQQLAHTQSNNNTNSMHIAFVKH